MTRALVVLGLVVATAVHLLPLWGVLSSANLVQLYQVPIDGNDLQLLMRHRAAMFGILGVFTAVALFRPHLRTAALGVAGASLAAFLVLAWTITPHNAALGRVAMVDLVAIAIVAIALVASMRATP